MVKALVLGLGVHLHSEFFKTALHTAAEGGELEMVKALVDLGPDVHALDNENCTALRRTSSCGHVEVEVVVTAVVVELGASVHAIDLRG